MDAVKEQPCAPSLRPSRLARLPSVPPAAVPTACRSVPVTPALRRGDQACRFKHLGPATGLQAGGHTTFAEWLACGPSQRHLGPEPLPQAWPVGV